ncbi:hypothetical protein [Breznakibacter xylanolyticus]|nr:hypothetical protein [Breznakibacter xylanolyticus]
MQLKGFLLMMSLAMGAVACSDDDANDNASSAEGKQFHVALAVGSDSQSQTYVQSLTDLTTGDVSFNGYGFEVPSTRTARIYASNDGGSLYNLDYGGGRIYKYTAGGGQVYTKVEETNVQYAVGSVHPRWTKINEEYALLHNIVTENLYDDNGNYLRTKATAYLVSIKLADMSMGSVEQFEVPYDATEAAAGNYVMRIDAPVVANGKAYYGLAKRRYNASTGAAVSATYTNTQTLVVDFPSLANPTLISTSIAKGATNGYRTPASHVDEQGDIYQILTVPNKSYETSILRIRNGAYDESFNFNLSKLLGENTISNGWFYVGNGIGYVPYANSDKGALADPVWSVARVDLKKGTAVKLNLLEGLWLQQYQYSVAQDGKFYMAIAPKGEAGHIYVFDVTSESPDGFTKGAAIQTGADAYYIGIF